MKIYDGPAVVEAILFAHGDPISSEKLSEASGIDNETLVKIISQLERRYNA
ncbi:MAG: SMC-Scp complex subunit ScpB, partial [Eubacterium sp.]|nr:SMC-Scp complex subunit ScpB [Eubacterium sp.]